MTTDNGRCPSGRATHERSRVSPSPPTVSVPNADDDLEAPPATLAEYLDSLSPLDDEAGWLIEEDAGGIIHWIALVENIWKYGWYVSERDQPSPVRRVKDSNEALRFARKQDAEAFVSLFQRFLLLPSVTEHCWPASAIEARRAAATQIDAVADESAVAESQTPNNSRTTP